MRRNAFLAIQGCASLQLLVSYLLISFVSDNKINSLSLAGLNSFPSRYWFILVVVHLKELIDFFLQITVCSWV